MLQVEEEAAAAMGFPVVLDDHGKRQIKVGSIDMHPTFEFKEYRTMLAEMVGVSHNKLTSYFVDNTKHLITSKVDFSTFGDKNGFFLVVLKKRSRKERPKKANKINRPLVDLFNSPLNHTGETASQMPVDDECKVDIWPQELEMKKANDNSKNYFKIQDSGKEDYDSSHTNTNLFPSMNELASYRPTDEDERPKIDLPFHYFCRFDKILEGVFRSPYGPIARPVKDVCCN